MHAVRLQCHPLLKKNDISMLLQIYMLEASRNTHLDNLLLCNLKLFLVHRQRVRAQMGRRAGRRAGRLPMHLMLTTVA